MGRVSTPAVKFEMFSTPPIPKCIPASWNREVYINMAVLLDGLPVIIGPAAFESADTLGQIIWVDIGAAALSRLVNRRAAHHRAHDLNIFDLLRGYGEEVLGENYEICKFAGRNRALERFLM